MAQTHYSIGDTVILKSGLLRTVVETRTCQIVSVLPADHGEVQYRVRFSNENFERRIVASDIDVVDASASAPATRASEPVGTSPWFRPLSVRATK